MLSGKPRAQLIAAIPSQALPTCQAARLPIKEMLTYPTARCLSPARKGTYPPRQEWMSYPFLCLWSPWGFLFPDLPPILGSWRPGLGERAWNPEEDGFLGQVAAGKSPTQQLGLLPASLLCSQSHNFPGLPPRSPSPPHPRSLEAHPAPHTYERTEFI